MVALKYCDMPYPRIILKYLFDMQQSNKMCDMVLIVENEEIHVHKLVLSAVSPYFSALANTEFKESVENKIRFYDINKSTLDKIIRFVYTGEIKIDETNVYEIMSAAHRFHISLLKLPISQYLILSLDSSNCLETLAYAHLYSYDEVFSETLKFIVGNFHFVVTKDIFLQAPADVVGHVLCQRGLNLNSILNTLGKWMKHNGSITEFSFAHDVTKENLELICNTTIENNPQFSDIVTAVLDFIKKYYCDKENKLLKKDTPLIEKQIILSIGGASMGSIHPTLEAYTNVWSLSLPSSPADDIISVIPTMTIPRMCFAVVQPIHLADMVYVVGGLTTPSIGPTLDSCERYDARKNKWTQVKETPKKVTSHAATWVEGKVVVTGGISNGDVTRDVWEYYEKDNRWSVGIPMLHVRSGHGTVNVMGTLYVLGGQGVNVGILLSSMERYNADLRTWSQVSDMPEAKYEFGCVAINEYIYVIGGATRHFVLNSVHKYNTLTDKWEQCQDMPAPKSSFGCTVRDGKIYCVGGSDIVHGPLSSVEVYNPQTNRWHYSSDKLHTPRSYSCAATVRIYIEES